MMLISCLEYSATHNIMQPGRQPLRGGEQIHVRRDKTCIGVKIGLLNLRVADISVGLPRPRIVPGEVDDVKDVHWSGRGRPSPSPRAEVPGHDRCQLVRRRRVPIDPGRQSDVEVDFL